MKTYKLINRESKIAEVSWTENRTEKIILDDLLAQIEVYEEKLLELKETKAKIEGLVK